MIIIACKVKSWKKKLKITKREKLMRTKSEVKLNNKKKMRCKNGIFCTDGFVLRYSKWSKVAERRIFFFFFVRADFMSLASCVMKPCLTQKCQDLTRITFWLKRGWKMANTLILTLCIERWQKSLASGDDSVSSEI